jgi:1-deoxy-D-xylulose-5-phosphate synthase
VNLDGQVGEGLQARKIREGGPALCLLGIGKMTARCLEAAAILGREGISVTLWDARVVSPADPGMLDDALDHDLVITVEDGIRVGGAGAFLRDAMAQRALARSVACPQSESLGIPRRYLSQATAESILAGLSLDAEGIAQSLRSQLRAAATARRSSDT